VGDGHRHRRPRRRRALALTCSDTRFALVRLNLDGHIGALDIYLGDVSA
jgi:hypothetical protein